MFRHPALAHLRSALWLSYLPMSAYEARDLGSDAYACGDPSSV